MFDYFYFFRQLIHHVLIPPLMIARRIWSLLKERSSKQVASPEPTFNCNYFMPERVPCFQFHCECYKLVRLLDAIPAMTIKKEKNRFILGALDSIDIQVLNGELDMMQKFELECLHCVINWLLHLIYFECSVYDEKLMYIAGLVADLLEVCVGGSSNVSFLYNWQHVDIETGSFYDARTLTSENVQARFQILPGEVGDSLWYFVKGHILMEARACAIFDGIIKLYTMDEHKSIALLRETLSSACDELKSILAVMSLYMHRNKILLEHWPVIQRLLGLPTFDGIRGLQNCWLFAINLIVNVRTSHDEEIQQIDDSVWKHLLHSQRKLMLKFKQNSDHLMVLCKNCGDHKLFSLFHKFVSHVLIWRSIHRSRASQFIGSSMMNAYKSTGSNQPRMLRDIQDQLDGRIKDFVHLQVKIRMALFQSKVSRRRRQHQQKASSENTRRRMTEPHVNYSAQQQDATRSRARTIAGEECEI